MIKFFNIFLLLFNLLLLCLVAYFIHTRGVVLDGGWTAPELLTIMLTALGVMIAVLTLVIGVLAIWGYGGLSSAAKARAKSETRGYLDTNLARMVEAEVERRMGASVEGNSTTPSAYAEAAAAKENDNANGT